MPFVPQSRVKAKVCLEVLEEASSHVQPGGTCLIKEQPKIKTLTNGHYTV